uniref:POLS protein n=1 Tax=Fopius arisanus TaxID=64838 RepID=A0A0C9QEN2_9HYME
MTTIQQQRPSESDKINEEQGDMVINPTMIGNMAPTTYGDTVSFSSGGNLNAVHSREVSTSLQQMRVVTDAHHSVEQMLSRRVLFDKTCDFSDTLVEFGFLEQWLKNPMVKTLLAPYAMFTGTYCVAVVINSQPTQAGMALLAASPQRTTVTIDSHVSRNVPTAGMGATAKQCVPFLSGLQNVLINLASSSESVLRVPYVGSRAMNEMSHLIDTSFVYTNISALRSAASGGKLAVQFYGWMEDLVLYGTSTGEPTISPFVGIKSVGAEPPSGEVRLLRSTLMAFGNRTTYVGVRFESAIGGGWTTSKAETSPAAGAKWAEENFLELGSSGFLRTQGDDTWNSMVLSLPTTQTGWFSRPRSEVEKQLTVQSGLPFPVYDGTTVVPSLGNVFTALNGGRGLYVADEKIKSALLEYYREPMRARFQAGDSKGVRPGREKLAPSKESHEVGKEAEEEGIKISTVASAIGKVAGFAAKIPVLSDFALPVEWAANGVADVARFFGFSKPHVVEVEKPVVQRPFYHFAHGAGANTATKMSVNPDQGVQVVPLGPEKEDEMSLAFLTQRPGLYFNMEWKTTNVRGDCLFQDPMLPSRFYIAQKYTIANVDGSNIVKFNTHLSYLAELFMYYVGSLLITLNLGATKFHSGRLRFVFVPQMSLPTLANDAWPAAELKKIYSEQNKNYHMVMDVRDAMTFTFKTPFEPGQPVVPCEMGMCVTVPALFVFVEVPLVAMTNVSQSVDGWFSVSGGPGFRFVGPRISGTTKLLPFSDGVLSRPGQEGKPLRGRFQGYDSYTRTETSALAPAVVDMSGGLNETSSALAAQTMTCGDVVESLRMLMKRPSEALFVQSDRESIAYWYPWYNSTLTGEKYESETFLQRIRTLYRFSSGGLIVSGIGKAGTTTHRFKLADLTNSVPGGLQMLGRGATGFARLQKVGAEAWTTFSQIPHLCESLCRPELEGMWSFELPYYNQYDKTDNMLVHVAGNGTSFDYVSQFTPPVALCWIEGKETESLYLAAAEDYNCGYLNGPPITFVRPAL